MATVAELLKDKGSDVWSIGPEQTVFEAIKSMDEKNIGSLTVVVKGRLVGIISERDYARKVVLKGLSSKNICVKDIMTTHVFHTVPEQDIETCMVIMTTHRIRHLPVLVDKELVGVISMGDVVNEIIKEQKDKIQQLENTVTWQESY